MIDRDRSRGREDAMDKKRKWIAGGALALGVVTAGAGIAIAAGGGEQQLTGSALGRATAAALEHTGGGTVIEAEAGDDGAAYGVEIRLDDGSVVELLLDADLHVTGDASDDDGAADQDGTADQGGEDQD
jgi:uncharacterized membrane protein YkoI